MEALRCLALCDRIHRVTDVSIPVGSSNVADVVNAGSEKTAKAQKVPVITTLPSKDTGKKGAKLLKTEVAFDAASTLAAVSAALKPITPKEIALIPGLDSEVKVSVSLS